ncbi:MAG: arginase family protein [Gemmatimonadota bacterium]|nr:arginase family protein [Gemmatimonadota bacterium]
MYRVLAAFGPVPFPWKALVLLTLVISSCSQEAEQRGAAGVPILSAAATAPDEAPLPDLAAVPVSGDRYFDETGQTRVGLVKMPYHGGRNIAELSDNPDYLEAGGILRLLVDEGADARLIASVALTNEEERQYGERARMAMANAHLADFVYANERDGLLSIGLLANCTSVLGVLAGLQESGTDGDARRVGLVFIDAHGDFNTPETSLSGMLGGMPVAVSAGMALHNLRRSSGLEPALPTRHIVMAGVRDLDPLEAELVDDSDVQMITVEDIRSLSDNLHAQMTRLSEETDVIYVHIDMDVLDPLEVPGHSLNVADGPSSLALGAALTEMFEYPKVAALGIASTPSGDRDPDGVSRQAAYNLIQGAIEGVRRRAEG